MVYFVEGSGRAIVHATRLKRLPRLLLHIAMSSRHTQGKSHAVSVEHT